MPPHLISVSAFEFPSPSLPLRTPSPSLSLPPLSLSLSLETLRLFFACCEETQTERKEDTKLKEGCEGGGGGGRGRRGMIAAARCENESATKRTKMTDRACIVLKPKSEAKQAHPAPPPPKKNKQKKDVTTPPSPSLFLTHTHTHMICQSKQEKLHITCTSRRVWQGRRRWTSRLGKRAGPFGR